MDFQWPLEYLELDFSIDLLCLDEVFFMSDEITCSFVDVVSGTGIGNVFIRKSLSVEDNQAKEKIVRKIKRKHTDVSQTRTTKANPVVPVKRKDIETALTDLNLIPEIDYSETACSMCPYVATARGSLKIHYKLKHFGGAGLIETCEICNTQVKTKGGMKKHYIKVHHLSEDAAKSMTWRK